AMLTSKSQVLFSEDFTYPFAGTGWYVQNNTPSPGNNWIQSSTMGTVFPAYNGNPPDYIAANFASTSDQNNPQTLSNWLITPTLNLQNGAVVKFFTRIHTNPTQYPDNLEVYMSTA